MATLAFVFAVVWFVSTALARTPAATLERRPASRPARPWPPPPSSARPGGGTARSSSPSSSASTPCLARLAALLHPFGAASLLLIGAPPAAFAFTILHGAGNGIMTIARGPCRSPLSAPRATASARASSPPPRTSPRRRPPSLMALVIDQLGANALYLFERLILLACLCLFTLPMTRRERPALVGDDGCDEDEKEGCGEDILPTPHRGLSRRSMSGAQAPSGLWKGSLGARCIHHRKVPVGRGEVLPPRILPFKFKNFRSYCPPPSCARRR
jgi:hypothetical protein